MHRTLNGLLATAKQRTANRTRYFVPRNTHVSKLKWTQAAEN